MTKDEIRALLARTEGRICGRLYRRADGTLMTSDCPSGLQVLRQRMSRLATAVIAAMFSVAAFASETYVVQKHGSNVKLEIERSVSPQQAVLTGVVRDEIATPFPGVTVMLRNEGTKREIIAVTDANGAFTLGGLSDGIYRLEVTLAGFKPAVVEHFRLKQNEITRARVALLTDAIVPVIMGGITVEPAPTPRR